MADFKENLLVRSGNKIIVRLAGTQVGLIRSVRMSDDYGHEPATGIGDAEVQEYVPTVARHSLSVQNLVLINSSLRQVGIAPENVQQVLKGLVFDIEVTDKTTGRVLRTYTGVSYVSGDTDVSANAMVAQSCQMMALSVRGKGD